MNNISQKQRVFTDDEIQQANQFLVNSAQKIEQSMKDFDVLSEYNIDNVLEDVKLLKDRSILFSQFCFCFPKDTFGNEQFLTNGLDTPLLFTNRLSMEDSYCFTLWDKNGSDPGLYLAELLESMLPEYITSFNAFFYTFSLSYLYENPITVRDVKNFLLSLGLEYREKNCDGHECLFKNYQ